MADRPGDEAADVDPTTGGERYWDGSGWATLSAPPEQLPVSDLPDIDYKELLQGWGGFVGHTEARTAAPGSPLRLR